MIVPRMVSHYSTKISWLASVLLLLSLASPALAADEFTVENVAVDATGKNATDARAKALVQGETDAFKQLATKRDAAKGPAIAAKTPPEQISTMVRGYEVVSEKIAPDHYSATLIYHFDPRQVQALLGTAAPAAPVAAAAAATPPAATPAAAPTATPATPQPVHTSKAVLVLPVYTEGNRGELWQDDNKWRSFWYESALESGGGLVIAPLGDLDDRVDVDDTNVDNATSQTLSRMYGRYGVGAIYVVSAFYNLKADPKPALEITLKKIGNGAPEISHMSYTIHSTETLDTLMVRASNDIAKNIYKQQTIDPNKIEYERLKDIDARLNTSDIREWESLRQHLLARGNIVSIKLTSISFYETTMIITYKGTADMLGKTLVASGLRVMQDGDKLVLALR